MTLEAKIFVVERQKTLNYAGVCYNIVKHYSSAL